MAFSINTNVASLQAQNYLQQNSNFQSKTIGQVTSGLRIVNSGDDAAGLAVANGYRSDEAVLTQGIQNANNGLSTLQTIDSGMSNISTLLDRARTLATESASGTFTGDRGTLNSEFQSVITEISRQAQAIGMNQGGQFAKDLSVFVGGGKGATSAAASQNGSIDLNLSQSTVDAQSLGLSGVQTIGTAGTDIGVNGVNPNNSANSTSVSSILANTTNTGSEAQAGYTVFKISGAGFSGANQVSVAVNTAGVTNADTLVTAINAAIANAGNGTTPAATALKNANVTAGINVDINGKSQLTFSSSQSAIQVQAGDQVANALLGNFAASNDATGKSLATSVTAAHAIDSTGTDTFSNDVFIRIQGGGLASPVDLQVASNGTTVTNALTNLTSMVANNAQLQAAGISLTGATAGGTLSFSSKSGQVFSVSAVGDAGDGTNTSGKLGLGTYQINTTTNTYDYSTITAGAVTAAPTNNGDTDTLEIALGSGTGIQVAITGATTDTTQTLTDKINAAIQGMSGANGAALRAAGIYASNNGAAIGNSITLSSSNGTAFRVASTTTGSAHTADHFLGFDAALTTANAANSTKTSSAPASTQLYDAGGETATKVFTFNPLVNGSDTQTLNFSSIDSSGVTHTTAVVLQDGGTTFNARTVDEAVNTINAALQKTNDTTLQQVVAVKGTDANGNAGIKFVSMLNNFNVGVGSVGSSTNTSATSSAGLGSDGFNSIQDQGTIVAAAATAGGSTADISSQGNAESAVNLLATAVQNLGSAQAAVGKGENLLNYAVSLAQSQDTNEAASESAIRDANLAQEAANLTKAQILVQAGTAALAQANSAPQQLLSLLQGH